MKAIKLIILFGVFLCFAFNILGTEMQAVIYNSAVIDREIGKVVLSKRPEIAFEREYGITCKYYWQDKNTVSKLLAQIGNDTFEEWVKRNPEYKSLKESSFLEDLGNAQLLFFAQSSESSYLVFKEYPSELKAFLAKGGVIFMDFNAGIYPYINSFYESVGVHNPFYDWKKREELFIAGGFPAVPVDKYKNFPLLNKPWKLNKESQVGYSWWTSWSAKQIVPYQNPKYPGKSAAIIIQENVEGKGKVIFNHLPLMFRSKKRRGNVQLRENALSYIFGKNIVGQKKSGTEQDAPGAPVK